NEEGCFASNAYFANFFKLSKNRISILISGLETKGYIPTRMTYKPGTKQIEKRIIENKHTYIRNHKGGISEDAKGDICENAKDNNTSFNNTINNTDNKAAAAEIDNKQYIVRPLETWQKLWLFPNLIQRDDLERLIDEYS